MNVRLVGTFRASRDYRHYPRRLHQQQRDSNQSTRSGEAQPGAWGRAASLRMP
eukprot:SAG31_NODE_46406_length_254_cov_1.329032_1_plen_52_part_01